MSVAQDHDTAGEGQPGTQASEFPALSCFHSTNLKGMNSGGLQLHKGVCFESWFPRQLFGPENSFSHRKKVISVDYVPRLAMECLV